MRSVTGADIWNINSVESVALEYSRYNYNAKNLYQADQFRASDHDPVIIGISASGTTGGTATLNLLNFNDFHGRIGKNLTVPFAATIEQLRASTRIRRCCWRPATASALAVQFVGAEGPATIDVLNALGLKAPRSATTSSTRGTTT